MPNFYSSYVMSLYFVFILFVIVLILLLIFLIVYSISFRHGSFLIKILPSLSSDEFKIYYYFYNRIVFKSNLVDNCGIKVFLHDISLDVGINLDSVTASIDSLESKGFISIEHCNKFGNVYRLTGKK